MIFQFKPFDKKATEGEAASIYYSRRRPLEDFPKAMTSIWSCSKEGCNGWIRNDYSFEDVPVCAQCKSPMINSMKNLPILLDSSYGVKMPAQVKIIKKDVPSDKLPLESGSGLA